MAEWLSIEVFDGPFAAWSWQESYGESLTEAAIGHGVTEWQWQRHRWGLVLELLFPSDEIAESFRRLPAVTAALDAVPDPVNGLLVYRGRGGGAGRPARRKPGPLPSAGAAERPIPPEDINISLASFTVDR